MRQIFKYTITNLKQTIEMPERAQILKVGVQRNKCRLWVLCDDSLKDVRREFVIFGTGEDIDDINLKYLGTFMLDVDSYVGHLFERNAK
jgi:hypothetical protein